MRATARSTLELPWLSLDFFLHRAVRDALGDLNANEALYLALFKGRMRIPLNQADAVIDLIGMECARACTCLPNYRNRFRSEERRVGKECLSTCRYRW